MAGCMATTEGELALRPTTGLMPRLLHRFLVAGGKQGRTLAATLRLRNFPARRRICLGTRFPLAPVGSRRGMGPKLGPLELGAFLHRLALGRNSPEIGAIRVKRS